MMHQTLFNSKVSKNYRNQGLKLFSWAFAISTMLCQSLYLFIIQLDEDSYKKKTDALNRLKDKNFHRQLRNEIIMIPIPKNLSSEHNANSAFNQEHYLNMAFERVNHY